MVDFEARLVAGWKSHQAGDLASAEKVYREVLCESPENANAWCYLGMVCHDRQRFEEAVQAYRKALEIQSRFPVAWNNLGNSFRQLRRLDDAVAAFDQALLLKPDYVNAYRNKGTTLLWEGRIDAALECYRQALRLSPDDAETHKNIGVIGLMRGDFREGWPEYEWRLRLPECSFPAPAQPAWDGSCLDGKTLLLVGEQGLGDTIQFFRYGTELKRRFDCQVVLQCPAAVIPFLKSGNGVDRFVPSQETPPRFDVWCPLLSVPARLGHCEPREFPNSVPYLHAQADRVEFWRSKLEEFGGMRVGLTWQGNPQHQADRIRSIPFAELIPLQKFAGVQWLSLQKGAGLEQRDRFAGQLDVELIPGMDESSAAFLDSAAIMRNLDLVITIDSAIAHVAGSLGVPTWLLLAHVPDWRWMLDRTDSPWYPSLRIFRQPRVGDWSSVIGQIAEELPAIDARVRKRRPDEFRLASSAVQQLTSARHGLLISNRMDTYIGRSIECYGEFSEGEVELFRQFVRGGQTVIEAGANIGAHTIPLAKLVGDQGRVLAFEPQRALFEALCGTIALNSLANVECRHAALGAECGSIQVPRLAYDQPNNFGGLALGAYDRGEPVPLLSIDSLSIPRCDFLKADVEGMELAVLQGGLRTLRRDKPLLYLENDRPEKSPELISFLLEIGYQLYWHVPPLYRSDNYFGNPRNEFPNLVSINMLGIPAGARVEIKGLRKVQNAQDFWGR
ncbi:MAG: FkbM family methyltransferase [Planctomycetes bacterium]|nr:FkbM family methyltransferase [Planctomycetota bacterium]